MVSFDYLINNRFDLIWDSLFTEEKVKRIINMKTIWESPIKVQKYTKYGETSYILGYADLKLAYTYYDAKKDIDYYDCIFFEIKPQIPSCGDLIRQIRKYQTVTSNAPWFVVSPDTKFKDIILQQDIGLINTDEYIRYL